MLHAPRHLSGLLLVGFALAAPSSAFAQIQGRVADAAGGPLPGALVEVWSTNARLAVQVTNQAGQFVFPSEVTIAASLLTVRRIGYQPKRVELPHASPLVITLNPFVVQLSAITGAVAPPCPNTEDRDARALWEAARHQYRAFDPGAGAWAQIQMVRARVPKRDLGVVDTSQAVPGEVAVGPDYFRTHSDRAATTGYAIPYQGLSQGRFDHWEYPWLDSFFAGHFLDSTFGRLHRLSFESREHRILRFCPRDHKRPEIQGTIEFGADSAPSRATWIFLTQKPEEEAGGEVLFARPEPEVEVPVIFPLVGLFWRKLVFDYFQEWMEFLAWDTCERNPDPTRCQ